MLAQVSFTWQNTVPYGMAEEAARKCIEMNSCKYFTYKQVLKKDECEGTYGKRSGEPSNT